jgi:hypothetical protein
MSFRVLRAFVLIAMSLFTSGVPQVMTAALDDDCCVETCDGALDGKHCPPNCDRGECAKAHASIIAIAAPFPGPGPSAEPAPFAAHATPQLPLVTSGVFHPPRA